MIEVKDRPTDTAQLDLFESVRSVYEKSDGELSNEELYASIVEKAGISSKDWVQRAPIGAKGEKHNLAMRKVRWHQQTLKSLGLIERVAGKRGMWRATGACKKDLTPAQPKVFMVAYSTNLGVAIWGSCHDVFAGFNEPIHLCLTSPPYALRKPRAYGNPSLTMYVDFVCESLEPIVKNLVPGGSICLNISNDIFEEGSPARSLYRERLVIALHERLGLWKLDELIWENKSKAPGPIAWASKKRVQLGVSYEPIYWFTNDPQRLRSDNRRVLQPHSEKHQKLIESGGEKRTAVFADGANRLKVGSFSNPTLGKIPRNILSYGHRCARQRPAREAMASAGLPVHGAAMPFALADFLVKFLTQPGDLVVEPFSGLGTTPEAAEANGCRWFATELMYEYNWASSHRFEGFDGFERNLEL